MSLITSTIIYKFTAVYFVQMLNKKFYTDIDLYVISCIFSYEKLKNA